jgi:uncharacterized protein YbjT (DUF2867 family)
LILVAGATGHLGVPLLDLLTSRGERVRVLTRDPIRARGMFAEGVDPVWGDVSKPPSLEPAMAGIDTVVSAVTGFGPGGRGPRAVDLHGNENLITAAEAAGAKHFVLVSMHGARADHPLELYRSKFSAEQRLQASRLAWTIIRPTVFMELWAGILGDALLKGGKAVVFGRGENPINFVSVRDVARFVELAVADPQLRGKVIEVGGPENLTLNGVVRVLAASSGRSADSRHVPLTALRVASLLMRVIRPDLAGLLQAAALMDSGDMSLSAEELAASYPAIRPTRLADAMTGAVPPRRLVASPGTTRL